MFHVKTAYEMVYLFTLKSDYNIFIEDLIDIYFNCEFGYIHDGHVRIFEKYSWDGCTCAINTSKTYYPCLVHDFLCQYEPTSTEITDKIFLDLLQRNKFELSYVYYLAVITYHKIKKQLIKLKLY